MNNFDFELDSNGRLETRVKYLRSRALEHVKNTQNFTKCKTSKVTNFKLRSFITRNSGISDKIFTRTKSEYEMRSFQRLSIHKLLTTNGQDTDAATWLREHKVLKTQNFFLSSRLLKMQETSFSLDSSDFSQQMIAFSQMSTFDHNFDHKFHSVKL